MPHSAPACDEAQMVWLLPVDWWPLLSDRGRMLRGFSILVLSLLLLARPVMAQQILRDAETEALFNSISAPLEEAAGLDPRNVQVLLINDPEINAFVAGGQIVWIHSGLLAKADNVNQLQGVIAHELGHIEGVHIIRSSEGMGVATGITLLSLLLGAAAMAAGGGRSEAHTSELQSLMRSSYAVFCLTQQKKQLPVREHEA